MSSEEGRGRDFDVGDVDREELGVDKDQEPKPEGNRANVGAKGEDEPSLPPAPADLDDVPTTRRFGSRRGEGLAVWRVDMDES